MDRSYWGSSKNIGTYKRRLSLVQSLKKTSSGVSVSGRSNQSVQIVCRTASHMVEHFGSSLPVLVTEALTFVDRNAAVSVNVSQDGWAWLVCGRRLLVWQCKITIHDPKQRRTFKSQCRELLLPQSDLAHKAECIAVWLSPGQQVPSCMAVSPEGIVRYWSSIANEESSIETSAELAGQEVDCLTYISGQGCILATTTCTVVLLQIHSSGGRSNISCRVLRTSKGWFGGIGRRMSSLIFGSLPQSPILETKLVKVVSLEINEKGSRILILAGNSLQSWYFSLGEQEKMEFDEDISQLVTQTFQKRLWEANACNPQNINIWLIDMQTIEDGVVLLMAAQSPDFSPQIHFSLGSVSFIGNSISNSFKWFIPIKVGPLYYNENIESVILSYKFILSGWEIIVYNEQNVLVISNLSEYEQDKIDLTRGGEDNILGGSLCTGTPVLFTRNLGLITITSADFSNQDLNASYSEANLSVDYSVSTSLAGEHFSTLISNEDLNEMFYSSDGATQLRAAFALSLRNNKTQCNEILNELFPAQEEPVMDIDASLDTLVLKVAKDLIDDYPANDPRWANHRDLSTTLNSVLAIKIPSQLEGKQKALELFVLFLIEYNLWNRFCAVTHRGIIMSTTHVLGEFAEKIVAMLSIYNLLQKFSDLIDSAIEKTLTSESYVSEELSSRDIFFREVSAVHLFIPNLVQLAIEQTQSERPVQQLAQYILQVNSVIMSILHEVLKFRQANFSKFIPPRRCPNMEYLPWTAAAGEQGLRSSLNTMQNVTLQHGVNNTSHISIQNELYEQLVGIIDLILDGRKNHLESVRKTDKFDALLKQYETERLNLIQPLIQEKQYESAAALAEKYYDFSALIQICELTNNKNRLDGYMERFASQDFAGFLFTWYVKHGRQGQLLERCLRSGAAELTEKLNEHPSLAWVQAALANEFSIAAETLNSLATRETDLVTRKKSMLSLSKLAFLASDETEDKIINVIKKIDSELNLIAHQEDVPAHVLEMYGYDIEKLRVLTPSELINLYTCLESQMSNEYDFKKALDLLDYIEEEDERSSLKLKIWARAAKSDGTLWDSVTKNPEQQIQQTLFFKLMDLVHLMGSKVEEALPPLDMVLMEPEIGNLSLQSNFQYLFKLMYEYAYSNY